MNIFQKIRSNLIEGISSVGGVENSQEKKVLEKREEMNRKLAKISALLLSVVFICSCSAPEEVVEVANTQAEETTQATTYTTTAQTTATTTATTTAETTAATTTATTTAATTTAATTTPATTAETTTIETTAAVTQQQTTAAETTVATTTVATTVAAAENSSGLKEVKAVLNTKELISAPKGGSFTIYRPLEDEMAEGMYYAFSPEYREEETREHPDFYGIPYVEVYECGVEFFPRSDMYCSTLFVDDFERKAVKELGQMDYDLDSLTDLVRHTTAPVTGMAQIQNIPWANNLVVTNMNMNEVTRKLVEVNGKTMGISIKEYTNLNNNKTAAIYTYVYRAKSNDVVYFTAVNYGKRSNDAEAANYALAMAQLFQEHE